MIKEESDLFIRGNGKVLEKEEKKELTGWSLVKFALGRELKSEIRIDSQGRQERRILVSAEAVHVYFPNHRTALIRRFRRRWRRHRRFARHQIRQRHTAHIQGVSGSPHEQHLRDQERRHHYRIHPHYHLLLLRMALPFLLPGIYSNKLIIVNESIVMKMKRLLIFNSQTIFFSALFAGI